MSNRADGAEARRYETSAAEAPYCAGFAVLLRWHDLSAGTPRGRDASKMNGAGMRGGAAAPLEDLKELAP